MQFTCYESSDEMESPVGVILTKHNEKFNSVVHQLYVHTCEMLDIYGIFFFIFAADKDIYEVCDAVYMLCARWSHLCFGLKLPLAEEEAIAKTYSDDPGQCLKEVLKRWLRKNYDYHKYGHPSWRFLVRAVGDPNGGNDCALAETIGKNHAGKLKCCF